MQEYHDYEDRAVSIYEKGFNCAQAVLGAFADDFGISEEMAMRMASSLGGGIGYEGGTCGAALGMVLAVGLGKGYISPEPGAKLTHTERVKKLMTAFGDKFGNMSCSALREVGNRAVCMEYVRYATRLAANELAEK